MVIRLKVLKMRWFVLCAIFLVIEVNYYVSAVTEAQLKSGGKLMRKNCQPKSKVTDEQIENMHKGIWDDDPAAQCYIYCLMNSYKLVDKETGAYDEESTLRQLDVLPKPRQEPTLKSVTNCKGSDVGNDKCERAYNFVKCFYFDNPENYFAP